MTILGLDGKPLSSGTMKNTFQSGLQTVNPFVFPEAAEYPGSTQLSQITTLDKNLRWYFVSNFRQTLSQAYCELGLIRTVIDVPVDDAYSGGFTLFSKQLSEDQIEQIKLRMEREKDITVGKSAQKWQGLFGGGGVIALVSDQDPETPLDVAKITEKSKLELRAVDMWELIWNLENMDDYSPNLSVESAQLFNYYGENIDRSRVLILKGLEVPSFVRPRMRGWGASKVETMIRSMNRYLKEGDLVFEVLDEFKLDIFKIFGQQEALNSPEGEELLRKRVQYANGRKNFQRATILDAQDDFIQRQLSFAGLSDVGKQTMIQVAADLRMPLTKIFGLSAAGFNSGEDDIKVYNDMVESTVRGDQKYILLRMAELRCQEMFGFIPDDLTIELAPMRYLSTVDEESIKTQKSTRLEAAFASGNISKVEYREAANKGKLFDVKLDTSSAALDVLDVNEDDDDDVLEEGEKSEKPKATDKGDIPKGEMKNMFLKAWESFANSFLGEHVDKEIDSKKLRGDFEGGEGLHDGDALMKNFYHAENGKLWEKAKEISKKEYGGIRWGFVQYIYDKEGGKH